MACPSLLSSSTSHLSLSQPTNNSRFTGDPSLPHMYNAAPLDGATGGSGLTYNNPPRKRLRESPLSYDLLQQTQDVDRLILSHTEKVRSHLQDLQRQFCHQVLAAVEDDVSKRLSSKDVEIERIGKLNFALEEQIRGLHLQSQSFRELAQNHQAAVVVLRSNIEQKLAARSQCEGAGAAKDAESCCVGDNCDEEQQQCDTAGTGVRSMCGNCGNGESSVLLLPCRHLCLCSACGPAVNVCPVCRCRKYGTIHLNLFL